MKKLIVVLGSSRKESVSKKAALRLADGARENGYEVVTYDMEKLNVKGCMGCGTCRKNGSDCIIADDMQGYFEDLHTCDALVLASPNYYSQIAGPMITFMNRHYCMTNGDRTSRLSKEIQLVGIFAQGAPESYERYGANYDWYLSTFQSKGMKLVKKLVIGGDSDTSDEGAIMTEAYNVGKSL